MQPEEAAEKLKKHLIELRRKLIDYMLRLRSPSSKTLRRFIELQQAIEAANRAVEDEDNRGPSFYETKDLTTV